MTYRPDHGTVSEQLEIIDHLLEAPFPWRGGKSLAAHLIWPRLGKIQHYIEPFFGSGAVLLGRPQPIRGLETVNDLDGYVANFWRAVRSLPEETAAWADWPANENDLHARHAWLVRQRTSLRARLEGDPDWCDPKIAGWWVWGVSMWIGKSNFCRQDTGPWRVNDAGELVRIGHPGISRRLVVKSPQGVHRPTRSLVPWFQALAARLRRVRVCSGDWMRVCGPSISSLGLTGILLDPPYVHALRADDTPMYAEDDRDDVSAAVRAWAIDHGADPQFRIALCGYAGEHEMPPTWSCVMWRAAFGNRRGECIWFSPHCVSATQGTLFGDREDRAGRAAIERDEESGRPLTSASSGERTIS